MTTGDWNGANEGWLARGRRAEELQAVLKKGDRMDAPKPATKDVIRRTAKRMIGPVLDLFDNVYLKVTMRGCIPPISLRSHVAPLELFVPTAEEYIAYFKTLGGLQMGDTILDIGCGPGRFAARLLARPHFYHGQYFGFDPDPRCIRWAKANLSKHYPRMEFACIDLMNSYYNPNGTIDPSTFVFPCPSERFDFVFAWSVFTHIMPAVTLNYLKEISRVLKPRKKALLTYLLLDGYPETLREDIIKARALTGITALPWTHYDVYSILYEDKPEKAVAYQRTFITDAIKDAGLKLESMHNGGWNHLHSYLSEQDVVIVSK